MLNAFIIVFIKILVLALMGHISNKIFEMKYEINAYGIESEIEIVKSEMRKIEIHFEN